MIEKNTVFYCQQQSNVFYVQIYHRFQKVSYDQLNGI